MQGNAWVLQGSSFTAIYRYGIMCLSCDLLEAAAAGHMAQRHSAHVSSLLLERQTRHGFLSTFCSHVGNYALYMVIIVLVWRRQ